MLKRKRKLTGFLLAAVMIGNALAGAVPMTSYADEAAISFQAETVCSQSEVILEKHENSYQTQEVYTAVYFSGDEDKAKWLSMSESERTAYLTSQSKFSSDNADLLVSTYNYGRVVYKGLTFDGKGIVVQHGIYSKTLGTKGNVTFELGNAKSVTTVNNVVERFGANSNISGSVTIMPDNVYNMKQKEKLTAEIKSGDSVNAVDIQWYSSNPEMISVTDLQDGRVVLEAGRLFPYASYQPEVSIYAVVTDATGVKIVARRTLTVKEGDPEFTLAAGEDSEFTLTPGAGKKIGVTVFPENAVLAMGNITAESDNPDVAAAKFDYATKQIQVTAGSLEGTAVLTVKAKINNIICPAVTIRVHVEDPDKKIEIVEEGSSAGNVLLDISEASGKLLTYGTVPENAAVTNIRWATEDDAIEIVEHEDGTASVLPLNPGKAKVQLTATVNGGIRQAACQVYVLTEPEITLTADGEERESVFLVPGGSSVLEAVTEDGYPKTMNAKTLVSWESSDETVATVSNAARKNSQAVVKAATPGDAEMKVTVTTEIPGVEGSKRTAEKSISVEVEAIDIRAYIDPADMVLKKGRTGSVTAMLIAETEREERPLITNVSWHTGDKKVVVAKAGQLPGVADVKAVGEGETTVGADISFLYGGLTQKITASPSNASVTLEPIPDFSFKDKKITVKAGKEAEARIKASPSDASVNSVTWKSSDPKVAEVEGEDLNTVIAGRAKGTAVITAVVTADVNGEVSDIPVQGEILVTVTEDEVSFAIKPDHLTVKAGEEAELTLLAKASSSNADYEILDVEWETSKESTADVSGDEEGAVVTGIAAGTATVKANIIVFINGREETREASTEITVTEDELNLKVAPEQLELKKGESGKLRLSSAHESAITGITWSSDSEDTATVKAVNEKGTEAEVTAVEKGETVITVKVTAFINGRQEIRTLTVPVTVIAEDDDNNGGNHGGNHSGGGSSSSSRGGSVGSTGVLAGSWQRDGQGWWFKQTNGAYPTNQWGKINQLWYYFGNDGYMVTGWQYINGSWYYLNPAEAGQGAMVTGWLYDSQLQRWFYLNGDGAMATGWQMIDGRWYYFNPQPDGTRGAMAADTWVEGFHLDKDGVWEQ